MPTGGPTVRDMLWKALAELVLPAGMGGNVDDARALITRAVQSVQPTGFLPWQLCNHTLGPDDANSLEFSALALGVILRAHASQLDPPTLAAAMDTLPSMLRALQCDTTVGCATPRGNALDRRYTNIWLANAAAQITLAGVVGLDPTVASEAATAGATGITQWNTLTETQGVTEYDSPTYYAADLEALEMAFLFSTGATRASVQTALDWFWWDIAANYFPARESLSGAHSRNYNFLEGYGGVDWFTWAEGWRTDIPQTVSEPGVERALALEMMQHADRYVPSAATTALAGACTKTVTALWGNPTNGSTRTNVVTPTYVLSSVSNRDGQQDLQFGAEIGTHGTPTLSVVVDDTDDPYGLQTVMMGLFSKPVHLVPRPLAVQRGGVLFGMLEITPERTSTSLATNVLFPLAVEGLYLDATPIAPVTQMIPASTGSVLGVRDRGGCVAVRIALADPYGATRSSSVELEVDATGLANHAGRLVAYHARPQSTAVACTASWPSGDPPLACQPRAAVVMSASACATDADLMTLMAAVRSATLTTSDPSVTTWTASLALGGSMYEGGRNRSTGSVVTQQVDGVSVAPSRPLCVNGMGPGGTCP